MPVSSQVVKGSLPDFQTSIADGQGLPSLEYYNNFFEPLARIVFPDGESIFSQVYTITEADALLADKADNATTLAGYGITDAYTKTATDTLLNGKANTSHTHAASDIASGTLDDARIAESSVTQHEGALTVTESQISDLARVVSVTAGSGLDGGTITNTGTLSLSNTGVSAGSYTNVNITVDAKGRVTAISSGGNTQNIPLRTGAQIGDINNSINTTGKVQGALVLNTTFNAGYIATGSSAGDDWVFFGNTGTTITPS